MNKKISPSGLSFYHRLGEEKNMEKLEYIAAKVLIFSIQASIIVIFYEYIDLILHIF